MTVKETTYDKSHLLVNRVFHPNSKKAKALHELVDNYAINNNISGGLIPIFNFLSHLDREIEPRTLDSIIIRYAGPIEYSHSVNCKCSLCNARLKQGSRLSLRLYGKDGKIIKRAGAVKNIGSLGSIGELYVGNNHNEHLYNIAKAVGDNDFADIIEKSKYKNEQVENLLETDLSVFNKIADSRFDEQQLSYILGVVDDLNKARYDKSVLNAFELPPINRNALRFVGEMIEAGKIKNIDVLGVYQKFKSSFALLTPEDALLLNLAVYELHPLPTEGIAGSLISDLKYLSSSNKGIDFNEQFQHPSPLGLAEERGISIDEKLKEKFSTRAEIVGIYRIMPGMDKRRIDHNRALAQRYSSPQSFEKHFEIVKKLVNEQAEEYASAKKSKRKANWFMPFDKYHQLKKIVELAENDRDSTHRNNLIRFSEMRFASRTFQDVYLTAKKQELSINHNLPAMAVVDFLEGNEENLEKFKHTPFGAENVFYNLSGGEYRLSEKYRCPFRGKLGDLLADKNFNAGIVVGEQIKLQNILKMYSEAVPVTQEMANKIMVLNKLRASPVNLEFSVNEGHLEKEQPYTGDFYPHFNPEKFRDAKYLFSCHEASINKAYELAEKAGLTSEKTIEMIELLKGVNEKAVLYSLKDGKVSRQSFEDRFIKTHKGAIRYVSADSLEYVNNVLGSAVPASEISIAPYVAQTWSLLGIQANASKFAEDVLSGTAYVSEELKQRMMEFASNDKLNQDLLGKSPMHNGPQLE